MLWIRVSLFFCSPIIMAQWEHGTGYSSVLMAWRLLLTLNCSALGLGLDSETLVGKCLWRKLSIECINVNGSPGSASSAQRCRYKPWFFLGTNLLNSQKILSHKQKNIYSNLWPFSAAIQPRLESYTFLQRSDENVNKIHQAEKTIHWKWKDVQHDMKDVFISCCIRCIYETWYCVDNPIENGGVHYTGLLPHCFLTAHSLVHIWKKLKIIISHLIHWQTFLW